MTDLIQKVKKSLNSSCLVRGALRKQGCTVGMRSIPQPSLAVDLDKKGSPIPSNDTRCDYLVFAEDNNKEQCFVPLELKGRRWDAAQVVRQLQAGARVAEQVISREDCIRFLPVLAQENSHKLELRELRKPKNRIRFHRHSEAVRIRRCGTQLVQILNFR